MAVRTYVPALKAACKFLQRICTRYSTKLEQSLGSGGYALLLTALEAVEAILFFIEENSDASGNFHTPT